VLRVRSSSLTARDIVRSAVCEELLYERRELFGAYNKGLSLLLTSELPWFSVSSFRADPLEHLRRVEPERAGPPRRERRGRLSTLDFEPGPAVDWLWAPTNVVRAVLEAYSGTGVLGLARRQGNRRDRAG